MLVLAPMGSVTDSGVGFDPSLQRFCLAQAEAFVVPAEALSGNGIEHSFASMLVAQGRLTEDRVQCLEAGYGLYWRRCTDLYTRAPRSWFPPRRTNLLVVVDGHDFAPYLEPFVGTSSTLYASDLDTHPEYVAWLIVHMERLSLLRTVPATVAYNLSYWFDRDETSRADFAAAAHRARRPDAAGFIALANAFVWIDQLLHDPLRAPADQASEPFVRIDGADLYVPKRLQPQLIALGQAAESAVRGAMPDARPQTTFSNSGPSRTLDDLCDWLLQTRAHVIVQGPNGGTLWTPQHDDPIRVRRMLGTANDAAVASIHADLRVVDERSRNFLERVADIDALPTQCAVLETGGGAYVDPSRRAVVYELQQPAFDARAGVAPPYHRLLLGARVMHEWGHVAHTAKILYLPEANRPAYAAARAELGELFAQVLAAVPDSYRAAIEDEMESIEPRRDEWPRALARKTLARVGDYLANMMSVRLIPGEEMQAYVRSNVRHHLDEQLGFVSELARYAYEVSYLDLVGLPRSYFYDTSRFPDYYITTGIVRQGDVDALFDAAARVLACYSIDETRLRMTDATA